MERPPGFRLPDARLSVPDARGATTRATKQQPLVHMPFLWITFSKEPTTDVAAWTAIAIVAIYGRVSLWR